MDVISPAPAPVSTTYTSSHHLGGAIIIAGALIGLGVFLGLAMHGHMMNHGRHGSHGVRQMYDQGDQYGQDMQDGQQFMPRRMRPMQSAPTYPEQGPSGEIQIQGQPGQQQ